MAPGGSSQPSHSQLAPNSSLSTHNPNFLPSTPHQNARDAGMHSRTPSPRFGAGTLSPRSVSSESNRAITSVRSVSQNCRYQWTKPALRRIPYTIGSELLGEPETPPKKDLEPAVEEQLSTDIRALYDKLLPTGDSQEKRKTIVLKLEKILREEFPGKDVEVSVFGSSGNLLFTSESDVDICIVISGLETVCTLAEMLAKRGMKKVQCVHAKAVPIVKIWDPELELACDLNVNNLVALKNTQMVKAYIRLDERIRPLAMIIKYWSKRRKINEASGGTLSSYTWTLLIINFLQLREPPILPVIPLKNSNGLPKDDFSADVDELRGFGKANQESLGALMFQFFRRYGHEIDYENAVVSVRQGRIMTKKEKKWHLATNNRLCVEEPFNTDRNLGNTADDTAFRGLHLEIRQAFSRLSEAQDLASCVCELYEHPIGDTRPAFERPIPQPRPVLSRSASQSGRSARTPNGTLRGAKGRFDKGNGVNRRASNPANFGIQPIPNMTGLHPAGSGPGLYPAIQQPRTGIHDQLNRLSEQLTAQENHLRYQQLLMSQFQLQQALISGHQRASQTPVPSSQQRGMVNGYTTSKSVNSVEGFGSANVYVPSQYQGAHDPLKGNTGLVHSQHGHSTHPSSPSITSSTPSRRSGQRPSTPSTPGNSLRSHSQPARSMNSRLVPLAYTSSPYAWVIGTGQDRILANTAQHQPFVDAFGRTWAPAYFGIPTTAEPIRREYLGYGIGDTPQPMAMRNEYDLAQIPSYEDLQRERRGTSPLKQHPYVSSPPIDVPLASSPALSSTTDHASTSQPLNPPYQTDYQPLSPTFPPANSSHPLLQTSRDEPLILNGSYEQYPASDALSTYTWPAAFDLKSSAQNQNMEAATKSTHLSDVENSTTSLKPVNLETSQRGDRLVSSSLQTDHSAAMNPGRLSEQSISAEGLPNRTLKDAAGQKYRKDSDYSSNIKSSSVTGENELAGYEKTPLAHSISPEASSRESFALSEDLGTPAKSTISNGAHGQEDAADNNNLLEQTELKTGRGNVNSDTNRRSEPLGLPTGPPQSFLVHNQWQPARRKGKRNKTAVHGQQQSDTAAHIMPIEKDERKGG